jgi:hypothetical protein
VRFSRTTNDDDDDDGTAALPQTGTGTIASEAGVTSRPLLATVLDLTALVAVYGVRRRLDGVGGRG